MATLSAIASNLLETIGLAQPRMEVMVREDTEGTMELHPLRMQWVREVDCHGRKVVRVQWVEDKQRKASTSTF